MKRRHVEGVDVVSDLFALVAVDEVLPAFDVALHEVAQEPMQLDARVVRARQASAAKAARLHPEVAAVLLHHHVGRDLRGAEERVLGLVDAQVLADAAEVPGPGVLPAGLELLHRQVVRGVAVDLVRRHVDERGGRHVLPRRLEQVQRTDGVRVEVVEGDLGREVVRRLRGGVDDRVGLHLPDESQDAGAVADVELVVEEALALGLERALVPARVAAGAEERGAPVVVDAVDVPPASVEVPTDFGADEP